MTDRPDPDITPTDLSGAGGTVDPDAHPAHVEEWRSDRVPPSDVDEEAVIDEETTATVQTDRGDTIIVPDEDRPVDLSVDEDDFATGELIDDDSIEDGFVDEQ